MENGEFIAYKKVLLFGSESTGKSTFSNWLKNGIFQENIAHTEEGNIIIYWINIHYSGSRESNKL